MPEHQRFQLPDLIGREAHLYPGQTAEVVRVKVEVTPGQYADVIIGRDLLTEMEPPPPEEPPIGSVVLVREMGRRHEAAQRLDDRPELPWEHQIDGATIRVATDVLCVGGVDLGFVGQIGRCLPADAAHAMAAALLAAVATAQERSADA